MTVNALWKLLGKMVEAGNGRKQVCIDKSHCNHVLESDGALILPITKAELEVHGMIDDDGGTKYRKNGEESQHCSLVLHAEHGTPPAEQRLMCVVEKERLVISIGLETLAFSLEHMPRSYDETEYVATDFKEFANDVRAELVREEEDGTSPLHTLLDEAMDKAIDNGSAYVKEKAKANAS